ncbi:MAG: class I SAM-dependent methyltransferase [Candidatus Nanohalobium sp.]
MKEHIIDAEKASKLEDESRYHLLSREELLQHVDEKDTVIEIGSGTGFYTDDLAEKAEKVYAVDFHKEMHEFYRDKGLPENVELIHSKASNIEIEEASKIISIFSFHEIDVEKSLKKFSEALKSSGKLLIVDWSKEGSGDNGPPLDKRFNAEEASKIVSEFFTVEKAVEREDTFLIEASRD